MSPLHKSDIINIIGFINKLGNTGCYNSIDVVITSKNIDSTMPSHYLSHLNVNNRENIFPLTLVLKHNASLIHKVIINTMPGMVRIYKDIYIDNFAFSNFNFFGMKISVRNNPRKKWITHKDRQVITLSPLKIERTNYD